MDPDAHDESQPDAGHWRRYGVWAVLLVLALVPFVIIEGPGARLLGDLGLTDQDESFTELYFPAPSQLPGELTQGAPLEFDFSIRNDEGTPITYRWQVRLAADGADVDDPNSTLLDSGELRLDDGESGGVRVERVTPEALGPTTVGVVLVGRDEAIHFPVLVVADEAVATDD